MTKIEWLGRSILERIDGIAHFRTAYAHCDIPCGIYDPHQAQVAAHTVIRMVQLINDLKVPTMEAKPEERQAFVSKMQRYIAVKEQHAELCKSEIRILWGDYFKPDHTKDNPQLHDLIWKTLKSASKARQEIGMDAAKDLLNNVEQVAEMFWKTKGINTKRVKSFYPTNEEIVYPQI